jgi:hypothetical protein
MIVNFVLLHGDTSADQLLDHIQRQVELSNWLNQQFGKIPENPEKHLVILEGSLTTADRMRLDGLKRKHTNLVENPYITQASSSLTNRDHSYLLKLYELLHQFRFCYNYEHNPNRFPLIFNVLNQSHDTRLDSLKSFLQKEGRVWIPAGMRLVFDVLEGNYLTITGHAKLDSNFQQTIRDLFQCFNPQDSYFNACELLMRRIPFTTQVPSRISHLVNRTFPMLKTHSSHGLFIESSLYQPDSPACSANAGSSNSESEGSAQNSEPLNKRRRVDPPETTPEPIPVLNEPSPRLQLSYRHYSESEHTNSNTVDSNALFQKGFRLSDLPQRAQWAESRNLTYIPPAETDYPGRENNLKITRVAVNQGWGIFLEQDLQLNYYLCRHQQDEPSPTWTDSIQRVTSRSAANVDIVCNNETVFYRLNRSVDKGKQLLVYECTFIPDHNFRYLKSSDCDLESYQILQNNKKYYLEQPKKLPEGLVALCQKHAIAIAADQVFKHPDTAIIAHKDLKKYQKHLVNLPLLAVHNDDHELVFEQNRQENITSLMLAAWVGDQVLVKSLLDNGANRNIQCSIHGYTAMHFAIASNIAVNKLALMKLLIEHGKRGHYFIINFLDINQKSLLHFAIDYAEFAILEYLLTQETLVEQNHVDLFFYALSSYKKEALHYFIGKVKATHISHYLDNGDFVFSSNVHIHAAQTDVLVTIINNENNTVTNRRLLKRLLAHQMKPAATIQHCFFAYQNRKRARTNQAIKKSPYRQLWTAFHILFRCMRAVAAATWGADEEIANHTAEQSILEKLQGLASKKMLDEQDINNMAKLFKLNRVLTNNIQNTYTHQIWSTFDSRSRQKLLNHAYKELHQLVNLYHLTHLSPEIRKKHTASDVLTLANQIMDHAHETIINVLSLPIVDISESNVEELLYLETTAHTVSTSDAEQFKTILQKILSNYMATRTLDESTETIHTLATDIATLL